VRSRILIPLVAIAVVGSIALYATDATSPSTRHVVHAPYTTTEVLEFFGFSAGRASSFVRDRRAAATRTTVEGRTQKLFPS
jgi:hypothetical protein